MLKTTESNVNENTILVTTEKLMELCSCGRKTAVQIGEDAQAKIQYGKRVLWCLEKVRRFVEENSI